MNETREIQEYPGQRDAATAAPRVVIYPRWCKGCGICIEFCPKTVLGFGHDNKAEVVAEDRCIVCGLCEMLCPDFAVTVPSRHVRTPVE